MRKILAAALLASATGFLTISYAPQAAAAETMAEERVAIQEVKKSLEELLQMADQAQRVGGVEYKQFQKGVARVKQALKRVSDNINGIVRRDIFRSVNKARLCARNGDWVCADRELREARALADKLRAG